MNTKREMCGSSMSMDFYEKYRKNRNRKKLFVFCFFGFEKNISNKQLNFIYGDNDPWFNTLMGQSNGFFERQSLWNLIIFTRHTHNFIRKTKKLCNLLVTFAVTVVVLTYCFLIGTTNQNYWKKIQIYVNVQFLGFDDDNVQCIL